MTYYAVKLVDNETGETIVYRNEIYANRSDANAAANTAFYCDGYDNNAISILELTTTFSLCDGCIALETLNKINILVEEAKRC